MLGYYGSLLSEALHQTIGIAKLEELPLTFLLGVLGAASYVAWKRYVEHAAMSEWKPLLFAAIAPIVVVFVGRFLWQAINIPVERAHKCASDKVALANNFNRQIQTLRKQLADYNAKVVAVAEEIENEDLAQEYVSARASLQDASKELAAAEAHVAKLKTENHVFTFSPEEYILNLKANVQTAQTELDAITTGLHRRLDSLRSP